MPVLNAVSFEIMANRQTRCYNFLSTDTIVCRSGRL